MMMNLSDLVGKRVLLKVGSSGYKALEVQEYRILEASPSGCWIKLMNLYGNKFWRTVTDVAFVEELREIKQQRPAD